MTRGWAGWRGRAGAVGEVPACGRDGRFANRPYGWLSCAKGVAEEGEGGAGQGEPGPLTLGCICSDCISKASTASTAARSTPGNHSRNCCTVAPSLRFSKRAETGTRVPVNTHAPLALSGSCSTFGHVFQSAMASPSWRVRRRGRRVKRRGPFDRLRVNGLLTPAPLDSCLRRNDARGVLGARGVGWRRGRFPLRENDGVDGWVRGGSGGGGGGSRLRGNDGVGVQGERRAGVQGERRVRGRRGRRLGGRRLRRWRRGRRRGRGLARGRFRGTGGLPGACCPRRGSAGGRRGRGS